ncbi:MAG: hypothetical protein H6R14_775 [Proteobacteria bacterium]|nr:hypothetical protein [Pseudomonadota bacterium]
MALKLITAPTAEPVTTGEVKVACRIDGTEFDVLLPILISAARALAEQKTGRAFGQQTWAWSKEAFPAAIYLPNPPLVSITKVEYYDTANVKQELANTEYTVDAEAIPAVIVPAKGKSWPSTYDRPGAVRIEYQCGHAAADAELAQLKQWIILAVATWIKNPEVVSGESLSELPRTFVDGLLDYYRVYA